MYARVICHPPLGEPTAISKTAKTIHFTALLDVNAAPERILDVALWTNISSFDEWVEHAFIQKQGPVDGIEVKDSVPESNYHRRFYSLKLPIPADKHDGARFTLKFRDRGTDSWKWVGEPGVGDGLLIFRPHMRLEECSLDQYLVGTDTQFQVTSQPAESPETTLWALDATVNPAKGEESGYSTYALGTPAKLVRWFAVVRLWSPWLAPRQGKDQFKLDKDAILCAFECNDGRHLVVLAVSGIENVLGIFQSNDKGEILAKFKNDAPSKNKGRLFAAVSSSFDNASAAVMYAARRLVMSTSSPGPDIKQELTLAKKAEKTQDEINPSWYEEWADGFAYCTWNGIGQDLSEAKILHGLETLEKVNIHITSLIIDDNWQSLDNEGQNQSFRGMTHFEANTKGFPNGLRGLTAKIREVNPWIKNIGVWHALLGYWGAISPDGQIAKDYKTVQARNASGRYWTVIAEEDVGRFYDDFYRFLSSSGITSVKTDAQMQLDELQSATDRYKLIQTFQDAWSISTLRHLSGRAISCMSQTPLHIFHSQLPTSKPRLLLRNSDDFFPDIESSHAWHIFCNAGNSLLTRYLNVLPDWDMFQTVHKWASYHAAARCVSGGPIYFTDVPGQHDVDLIKQMTAQTPRETTVILRPSTVGHNIHPYRAYEDGKLCAVATYHGSANTGTAILGVFNVSQQLVTEMLSLSDFPGTDGVSDDGTANEYIIRSHKSGTVSAPITHDTRDKASIVVDLGVRGCDVLSAYPLTKLNKQISIANLGLLGKFTSAAAIVSTSVVTQDNGRIRLWTALKALGTLGVYISNLDKLSMEDDLMAMLYGRPIGLDCVKVSGKVLEIDIAKAWEQGDKKPSWSNEVNVELFIRA